MTWILRMPQLIVGYRVVPVGLLYFLDLQGVIVLEMRCHLLLTSIFIEHAVINTVDSA